jgi:hypothetical protein
MDIKAIRRANLGGLLGQFETIEALARQTKTVASVLSQIKNGTRGMGNIVARKLETGLEKPFGWMDTLHFKSPDDAMNQTEAAQICASLSVGDREQWLRLGRLMVENGDKGPNNPFGPIKKGGGK